MSMTAGRHCSRLDEAQEVLLQVCLMPGLRTLCIEVCKQPPQKS
jgi:hypothetical protein